MSGGENLTVQGSLGTGRIGSEAVSKRRLMQLVDHITHNINISAPKYNSSPAFLHWGTSILFTKDTFKIEREVVEERSLTIGVEGLAHGRGRKVRITTLMIVHAILVCPLSRGSFRARSEGYPHV